MLEFSKRITPIIRSLLWLAVGAICLGYAYNTIGREFNLPEFNYWVFIFGVWGIRISFTRQRRGAYAPRNIKTMLKNRPALFLTQS